MSDVFLTDKGPCCPTDIDLFVSDVQQSNPQPTVESLLDGHAAELRAMGFTGDITIWCHRIAQEERTSFWDAWGVYGGQKHAFGGDSWESVVGKARSLIQAVNAATESAKLFDHIFAGM